ncbi:acyl--CoA ligase [Rhizobiales bacterium]|uniref:AMP-binding protein n=1 Tax=Hongsoonwoonella zoysiae TaxID=2821844 RepID=UPI0015603784|nr:class I adenylate-forming enzyme family protein [Hongsoonwoonella zoysiae]NRG18830.1 acyl--CoA ligase [Hongsoonwoonella zoysiae]
MILTSEEILNANAKSGIWGRNTLDALFRRAASKNPDRIAICDAPDRSDWTGGAPRQLTYGEADEEISRLAGFFAAVGLSVDNVLGLHAPNTVDSVITFLAALRAGLVVAPLPLHWRRRDVVKALTRAGAKALVAGDRVENQNVADEARETAAELFSLRFVFGIGNEVPDGLVDIASVLSEMNREELPTPTLGRDKNAADHVATLTWSRSTSGEPLPVARSHNHWIAAGFMPFLETGLADGAKILSPYPLTGMVGIGAGLVPWLMTGGSLHLHHPTALRTLANHADGIEADYVLCPGALVASLERKLQTAEGKIVSVWSGNAPHPAPFTTNRALYDLHVADEFAMIVLGRGASVLPRAIQFGPLGAPSSAKNPPILVEVGIDDETAPNTLRVRGPMVAGSAWPASKVHIPCDKSGYVDTLVPVRRTESGITGLGIPGKAAPGIGPLQLLDSLYSSFPGLTDAAAFLVEDVTLGARLYAALVPERGTLLDTEGFFAYLDAEGVGLAEVPNRVLSLPAIPRTDGGKVDREALAARIHKLRAAVA